MQFTMTVDMDSAAFKDPDELPHALRKLATRLEAMAAAGTDLADRGALIVDTNGAAVGSWEVKA